MSIPRQIMSMFVPTPESPLLPQPVPEPEKPRILPAPIEVPIRIEMKQHMEYLNAEGKALSMRGKEILGDYQAKWALYKTNELAPTPQFFWEALARDVRFVSDEEMWRKDAMESYRQLESIVRAHCEQTSLLLAQRDTRFADELTRHAEEIRHLKEENSKALDAVRAEEKKISDGLRLQIDGLMLTHENEIAGLKASLEGLPALRAKLDGFQQKLNDELSEAQIRFDEEKHELKAQLKMAIKDYEKERKRGDEYERLGGIQKRPGKLRERAVRGKAKHAKAARAKR